MRAVKRAELPEQVGGGGGQSAGKREKEDVGTRIRAFGAVHVRVCVYLCVRAGTPHEHVGSGVRRVWEIVWGEKV